jgi:hypothetical protein
VGSWLVELALELGLVVVAWNFVSFGKPNVEFVFFVTPPVLLALLV